MHQLAPLLPLSHLLENTTRPKPVDRASIVHKLALLVGSACNPRFRLVALAVLLELLEQIA